MKILIAALSIFMVSTSFAHDINSFCLKDSVEECEVTFSNVLKGAGCNIEEAYINCNSASIQKGKEALICAAMFVEGCKAPSVDLSTDEQSCSNGRLAFLSYGDADIKAIWDIDEIAGVCTGI